ncbi:unnamed protein product [Effrenium voratum]|uniref:RNA helicase n=1 Tax=Effrenium voratum TaxID=2562239 RepID=A0AA36HZL1_9DINO|nr:unnamed protein product [Effrenium voratum]CAJ1421262.1 unnamed protein product [Effrenium voratum]
MACDLAPALRIPPAPVVLQEGGSSSSRGAMRMRMGRPGLLDWSWSSLTGAGLLIWCRPSLTCRGARGERAFRGNSKGRFRKRRAPSHPKEQERQRESVIVPEGWGLRAEGLKKPWTAPWYKKRLARGEIPLQGFEKELQSLDRAPVRDFAEMLEQGRLDQGKFEVMEQSNISAARSRFQVSHPSELAKKLRELWRETPDEEKPMLFPHFRKAFDWDARESPEAGRKAPEHFFSQKRWEEVDSITAETTSLVKGMQLPKPSRIQFLSFPDIIKGRHSVIADQSGSGKTLAYLLPLLQRYVLSADPEDHRLKLIVIAPTSDLVHQIADVARVASAHGRAFRVTTIVGGGGYNARHQRRRIQEGCELIVATPGRLKFFMEEDYVLDKEIWNSCQAVVVDEVDALVGEEGNLNVPQLKIQLAPGVQWVFVTATVSEAAKTEIQSLEAQLGIEASDKGKESVKVAWTKGPGLHRVPLNCNHVLIDCTPMDFYNEEPQQKLQVAMESKISALVWHMQKGVLREEGDNRVVIFCNTINNCQLVYDALEKVNPDDPRSGDKQWKLLQLHALRDKQEYNWNMNLFSSEKVPAADFFKRRILICTDRLSRGMDFGSHQVKWVVLMDWPRDATEYIRRVGRTSRAGGAGSVLTLLCGPKETRMAKQITAAAVRSLRLTNAGDFSEQMRCLERFDPAAEDWRSQRAAAPKPIWKTPEKVAKEEAEQIAEDNRELTEKELRELFEEADMGPMDEDIWDDDDASARFEPWQEDMVDEDDADLWEDSPFDEGSLGISLQG